MSLRTDGDNSASAEMFHNSLRPSGHYMYHQFKIQQLLRSAHTVYLCVLCGSQNKQRIFPYTALNEWFLQPRQSVLTARYRLNFYPLKPSGHYMYHQFKIQQLLRSAHTVYLCVLCGSQNKQRLFPYTALTDWFLQQRQSVFTARYGLNF